MSSVTGDGFKEFLEAVEGSREEYEKCAIPSSQLLSTDHSFSRDYLPELESARAQREKVLQDAKDDSLNRVLKDLAIDREENPAGALADRWDEDEDEDEEADDEGELNLIDRCKYRRHSHFVVVANLRVSDAHVLFFFLFFFFFISIQSAEERGPGEYIDVTRARRHDEENINWPRPG